MNKNNLVITDVVIYEETQKLDNGFIRISEGKIVEVGSMDLFKQNESDTVLAFSSECSLLPGFIDLHIHGANGSDIMDNSVDALKSIAEFLPKEGTTSFLATTITQSDELIESALKQAAAFVEMEGQTPHADMIGIHLEGPFISNKRAGAQPIMHIKDPDIDLFLTWQNQSGHLIKLVTMAPEQKNGLTFLEEVQKRGVVTSIGHSDATYAEVQEAINKGLTHVTHLYNGMRGLHHREPGVAGATLSHSELVAEMIVDGVHIHPSVVNSTFKAKGANELILITDAMRAKGLGEGDYDLGGQQVSVVDGKALLEDGTLAGSILTMDEAVRNMMKYTGCSLRDIAKMTAENPAKQLGIWNKVGSIAVGKMADLVLLDENHKVVLTICKGKIAYEGVKNHEHH
ncbi:N-acetylglucosamine-6-phosphate deacetylase [Alkalihalophilus lindianensis]|uniref:N-acetylglucosamine-6-phosphate deacetylase n=1 Tax=Alkalihalophilus lindianensis TaxID=1630542 RepID=A0ABU3XCD6_9BACI|nr:N-acetylglucosamine-6-phosphate deacetylase [Alkalihalophilus lindianensis]MDV2685549.1 N-acetylglucosamine-6-phosphate deacetylase [Alkalihalophilus lindianensis]